MQYYLCFCKPDSELPKNSSKQTFMQMVCFHTYLNWCLCNRDKFTMTCMHRIHECFQNVGHKKSKSLCTYIFRAYKYKINSLKTLITRLPPILYNKCLSLHWRIRHHDNFYVNYEIPLIGIKYCGGLIKIYIYMPCH